jgi:protein-S-isoprenylcysteine O-methyltransferase Ste14
LKKPPAAVGTAVFLVVVPGVVAGVIPWLLTDWQVRHTGGWWVPLRLLGGVVIVAGIGVLLQAFARFVTEGSGTPAPIAPTEHLVVGGMYRYVRNPMYLAVAAVIVGQAMLLVQAVLLVYTALFLAVVAVFVRTYEEPTMQARYGDQFTAYCRAVPAWRARRTPWQSDELG